MIRKLLVILILILSYYPVHSQDILSYKFVNNSISTIDNNTKVSFVIGEEVDTIFIDYGEMEDGDLRHTVIKINSPYDSCIKNAPNSKSFINDNFRTMLWYYASNNNPLVDSNTSLPYKFAGSWDDTLSTTSTQSIEYSHSFFFNIIYYVTPNCQLYEESICVYKKIHFNNKDCIIAISAIVTERGYKLLRWIEDQVFRVYFTFGDFDKYLVLPPRIHIKDFNNDGFLDSFIVDVISTYYPGTYNDGVTFVSGKTHHRFYFTDPNFSNKDPFFDAFIKVDNELCTEENKPILKMVLDSSIYMEYNEMDPILDYYIRFNHTAYEKVDSPFNASKTVSPKWLPLPIKLPKHYLTWIEFDSSNMFDSYKIGDKGWIFYYGHYHLTRIYPNHHGYERIDSNTSYILKNSAYKLYLTGHGIIAQKENKYAWVFHASDIWRVRTPSTGYVHLYKKYVLCSTSTPDYGIQYMINIETGEQKIISISFDPRDKQSFEKLIRAFEK